MDVDRLQFFYSESERNIKEALTKLKHQDRFVMDKLDSMEYYIGLINEIAFEYDDQKLQINLKFFNRYNAAVQKFLNEFRLETDNVNDLKPRVFDEIQRSNENKEDIKRELFKKFQEFAG